MACPRAAASPSPSHPRRSIPRPRRWRISPRSPSFGATPSCRRSSPSRRSSRWRCARPIARSPTVSRPSACGPGSSMPRRRSTTAGGPLCAATTMSPWSAAIPSRSRPSPSSSACSPRRVSPSSGSCPTPRALTAPSGPDRPPLAASFMTAMELLIPSWADLAAWAGVLVAALVFIGVGRLLSRGRAAPEAALVAGWGGACVALTLWGVATAASLRWPAAAIAAAGLVGLVARRVRPDAAAWRGVLRMGVVALPLLAVMVSARPSLPDTFLNLLPAFALFLARLIERGDDAAAILPTWGATALGLLLATLINPGFVPRYHLSAYSETSVTVALAFAAWFAARALDRCAAQRTASAELTLLALTLAALVNIKQDSIALVAGLLGSALLLYAAWRWYVLSHFAAGELKPLPFAQWQFANIPLILRSMLKEMLEKSYFFAAAALAVAGLIWRLRRHGLDRTTRVAALFAGVMLAYDAALFVTYIGHFPGQMSAEAHSFFRYNTHLGLLLVLTLLLLARDIVAERGWTLRGALRRAGPAALVAVAALCPLALASLLRFDLEVPQLRTWQLAAIAKARLGTERRLALVLPGDNGSVTAMLEGLIRFVPPAHPDLDLRSVTALAPETFDRLARDGYRLALISCTAAGSHDVPAGRAVLLEHGAGGWRAAAQEAYPVPRSRRWSHVLLDAPLCL